MTEAEAAAAPADMKTLAMTGMADKKFAIVVSALDCTGCGSCANVCPGKKGAKALDMQNMEANAACQSAFDYAVTLPEKADVIAEIQRGYRKRISVQDCRCLSSQAHAQAVVRPRTQN